MAEATGFQFDKTSGDVSMNAGDTGAYKLHVSRKSGEDWTEEQLDQAFTQAMTEAKLVELEGTLILYEEDGQTQVEVGEGFWDAYYGGIMRVRDEYYEELFGGTSDEE